MKISKSLLSLSRSTSNHQPMSLPTCLSRRRQLSTIKAPQASPIFPTTTTGKKRSSAVENPEPSSPKVTCIGQVRIKTKKKKRHNTINGGNSNCLPLMLCEALRYDLSCFFPCRRVKDEEKRNGSNGLNGSDPKSLCARWLVTLQDGEGGKGREIELVVGGGNEEIGTMRRTSSRRRRHVLEDFEIKENGKEIEEGRVSICLPPKNALLLMRCRSDPMKVAALTNRFCLKAPANDDDVVDEDDEEKLQECEEAMAMVEEKQESDGNNGEALEMEMQMEVEKVDKLEIIEQDQSQLNQQKTEDIEVNSCSYEAFAIDSLENNQILEENRANSSSSSSINLDKEEVQASLAMEIASSIEEEIKESEDLENTHQKEEVKDQDFESTKLNDVKKIEDQCMKMEANENKNGNFSSSSSSMVLSSSSSSSSDLPDCLLLMMFEPKLSMEVSKETWVCSTDFIRYLPQRQNQKQKLVKSSSKKDNNSDEPKKSKVVLPPPAVAQAVTSAALPPRSSCSLPSAAVSMAAMIEHKLVNGGGYEPFVLTRCKSEPMRTAAKLAPDPCF